MPAALPPLLELQSLVVLGLAASRYVQGDKCLVSQQSLPLALPASTGCISGLGQCITTLTITLPSNCTDRLQAPYPTVLIFAGYQVPTRYYDSLAKALAQSGFAVMQVPLYLQGLHPFTCKFSLDVQVAVCS